MPRTYDEDGQPMMSNNVMLKMLVKEIPVMYKDLRSQIEESEQRITLEMRVMKLHISEVKSDVKGLHLQLHQNHTSFITNQMDQEKRIAVLEKA